jgi:hypothetical protein
MHEASTSSVLLVKGKNFHDVCCRCEDLQAAGFSDLHEDASAFSDLAPFSLPTGKPRQFFLVLGQRLHYCVSPTLRM